MTKKRISDLAFSLDSIPDLVVRKNRITLTLSFGEDSDKLFAGWDKNKMSYYIQYRAEGGRQNLTKEVSEMFRELPCKCNENNSIFTSKKGLSVTILCGENVAAVNANCRKLCALLESVTLGNSLKSMEKKAKGSEKLSQDSYFNQIAALIKLCVDVNLEWPLINWRQAFAFDLADEFVTVGASVAAFSSGKDPYREHVIPLVLVKRHAIKIATEGASVSVIARFLRENIFLVKLSYAEAEHLNKSPGGTGGKSLKESMPDGWKWGDDPMERLRAAGINVSLNQSVPRWSPWSGHRTKPGIRERIKIRLIKNYISR